MGLALVVMRSAQLYATLRLIGAAYLIGLGLWMLLRRVPTSVSDAPAPPRASVVRALATAYAANVLNVKAAAVYLTLAPQFLGPDQVSVAAMVALGVVHVVVMAAWLALWASGLEIVRRRVDPDRWIGWVRRAGGAVLVALEPVLKVAG